MPDVMRRLAFFVYGRTYPVIPSGHTLSYRPGTSCHPSPGTPCHTEPGGRVYLMIISFIFTIFVS